MYSSYFWHSTIRFDNAGNDEQKERIMATKLIDDTVWAACGRSFSMQPTQKNDLEAEADTKATDDGTDDYPRQEQAVPIKHMLGNEVLIPITMPKVM